MSEMEIDNSFIKNLIMFGKVKEIEDILHSGWDPNSEGGWPIRLAARYGCSSIVEILMRYGANPHLLSESGASTLQLAVYSGENWASSDWSFLLSCCDSSQLADAAAVAIIFNNTAALEKIMETGRCNTHIPTTLTGKTLEELAKGYKISHLLNTSQIPSTEVRVASHSPNNMRSHRTGARNTLTTTPAHAQRNLSPSVARFFRQTASQPALSSPRGSHRLSSPAAHYN